MRTPNRYSQIGWLLFVGCAVLYAIANVRARDWVSLAGSLLFLLACIVFLIDPAGRR